MDKNPDEKELRNRFDSVNKEIEATSNLAFGIAAKCAEVDKQLTIEIDSIQLWLLRAELERQFTSLCEAEAKLTKLEDVRDEIALELSRI